MTFGVVLKLSKLMDENYNVLVIRSFKSCIDSDYKELKILNDW